MKCLCCRSEGSAFNAERPYGPPAAVAPSPAVASSRAGKNVPALKRNFSLDATVWLWVIGSVMQVIDGEKPGSEVCADGSFSDEFESTFAIKKPVKDLGSRCPPVILPVLRELDDIAVSLPNKRGFVDFLLCLL